MDNYCSGRGAPRLYKVSCCAVERRDATDAKKILIIDNMLRYNVLHGKLIW